jgi:anti-anti-sigma regulatory factor
MAELTMVRSGGRRRAPQRLRITRGRFGRRCTLELRGPVTAAAAAPLARAVAEEADLGALEVWVDLSNADAIDADGADVLVRQQRALGMLNRRLVVICPPGPLADALAASRAWPMLELGTAGANRAG